MALAKEHALLRPLPAVGRNKNADELLCGSSRRGRAFRMPSMRRREDPAFIQCGPRWALGRRTANKPLREEMLPSARRFAPDY